MEVKYIKEVKGAVELGAVTQTCNPSIPPETDIGAWQV